jgi:hypothetical protein
VKEKDILKEVIISKGRCYLSSVNCNKCPCLSICKVINVSNRDLIYQRATELFIQRYGKTELMECLL